MYFCHKVVKLEVLCTFVVNKTKDKLFGVLKLKFLDHNRPPLHTTQKKCFLVM